MKKLILLSSFILLTVSGIPAFAATFGQGQAEPVPEMPNLRSMRHSGCMIVAAAVVCFRHARIDRSTEPAQAGESNPCVRMVFAPPALHLRLSDKIQLPDDSDGDSDVSVHLSPGDSPHPSSVQQALYGLELAQDSATSVAADAEFPAAPEETPQILVWLASYLEVRAGPVAA